MSGHLEYECEIGHRWESLESGTKCPVCFPAKPKPNDGGPAFPNQCEQFLDGPQGRQPASAWGMEGKPGMTLLDYFAGQALAGRTANGPLLQHMEDEEVPEEVALKAYARHAYKIAAAMLAERERLASPPLHP